MRRRLVLKRETLTELTPRELDAVAGGATALCPTPECMTDYWCQSLDYTCLVSDQMRPCLTNPCQ